MRLVNYCKTMMQAKDGSRGLVSCFHCKRACLLSLFSSPVFEREQAKQSRRQMAGMAAGFDYCATPGRQPLRRH